MTTSGIDYYRDQTVALEAFKSGRYDLRSENTSLTWATGYDFPARRDGYVKLDEVQHARPIGHAGIRFQYPKANLQRPRRAIAYAFDFEWSNKNLFFGQYAALKASFQIQSLQRQIFHRRRSLFFETLARQNSCSSFHANL